MYKKIEKGDTDLKLNFDYIGADFISKMGDLDLISGDGNLVQAIIHRLKTHEGELYDIGHADYGSRLHELIGEPNNKRTRDRLRNLVLACLSQEKRIGEVISVEISLNPIDPNAVAIEITVLPIRTGKSISLFFPFSLEAV